MTDQQWHPHSPALSLVGKKDRVKMLTKTLINLIQKLQIVTEEYFAMWLQVIEADMILVVTMSLVYLNKLDLSVHLSASMKHSAVQTVLSTVCEQHRPHVLFLIFGTFSLLLKYRQTAVTFQITSWHNEHLCPPKRPGCCVCACGEKLTGYWVWKKLLSFAENLKGGTGISWQLHTVGWSLYTECHLIKVLLNNLRLKQRRNKSPDHHMSQTT